MYTYRPRAFTLIELLVVISIVTLLVSLLLPVLASARDAAKDVACLSNLKQMGMGVYVYAGDYESYVVPVGSGATPATQWHRNPSFQRAMNLHVQSASDSAYPRALLCPRSDFGIEHLTGSANDLNRFYGMNSEHIRRIAFYKPNYGTNEYFHVEDVVSPSVKYLIMDGIDWSVNWQRRANWAVSDEYTDATVGRTGATSYRHNEGANMLFHDTHVALVSQDEVVASTIKRWVYNLSP